MNCSICHRPHHAKKLPFLCAVDARNRMYDARVEFAQALIKNEEAERQVEAALSSQAPRSALRVRMEDLKSEEDAAANRTCQIIAQADQLKADIDAAREEIEKKKEEIARRKSDLASVAVGTAARRSRQLDETERSGQRLRYKWNRSAETMAGTRAYLCEEAARLYGLRQVKKGGVKRYEIGGVEIVELHAMNNVAPEVISTSLAHIAHILVLASHYLAIRLPSEITLPHRDYPRPTMFSLSSSYRHGEVAFPGADLTPGESSGDQTYVPRPRPLFIDKSLPTLAKDSPQEYSLFLEGVSLLAYDIAWACCSQGVSFGDKDSYEDICSMGQNLWRLLIGDQLHRRSVEPTFPALHMAAAGSPKDEDHKDMAKHKPMIGRWSYGTTHTFLGGAEGTEFIRSFKILSPTKITDRLKKRLSSEAPMLEWEKIEGDEADGFEDGDGDAGLGVESILTVRTVSTSAGPPRSSGNGWTKVKSRYDK
ncbi:UV radiation resistance protein and autophagy-related subunit 14-domain-containing protein [Podospora appendiculata]|uniref:Autophagy-related protein 14 n=1 Tax=Podospora appendiculata TaxID=314037 RepID=A0AAE0XJV4_9PEZI|nr:UV radiation resistance protein and autophagy-related subunit 14-domain-containing protein [Podospora appendiculata]